MALEVLMPVISSEGEDAVVTAWFVDDGQACTTGQLIAEVQAEKVSQEIEAPQPGFVVDRVALGDPIAQGEPICRIVERVDVGAPVEETASLSRAPVQPAVRASPAAKRVARELGVDLSEVSGSGPDGRITEADVRASGGGGMTGLRAVIARNMRRSHAETAPVTIFTTVGLGERVPAHLTAVVVRAAAEALVHHADLNGTRQGDTFTPAQRADIGIAIQTADGLVAPVVRDPTGLNVDELAERIAHLADRARSKQLEASDFEGGTFTVTNLGSLGVEGFTPIIAIPQVAILGVGAARRVPVVDAHGEIIAGHEMTLSLTFDHAFVDGAPAAAFLQRLRQALEV
jgi:pyruvate dehydrogenase E2 component (dihydrolipoamide acetyltransferase)